MGNMNKKRKPSKEVSLASLADDALNDINKLSDSQQISDKLIAFNLVLFILILGFDISYWLKANPNEPLAFGVFILVSMIFSSIVSIGYNRVLSIISNLTANKIEALRIGVTIMLIDLSLAITGTLFQNQFIVNSSASIILVQMVVILVLGFINFETTTTDRIVKPNQLRETLGDLASIISILSFIIDIGIIVFR
jgi:hypothetical protein